MWNCSVIHSTRLLRYFKTAISFPVKVHVILAHNLVVDLILQLWPSNKQKLLLSFHTVQKQYSEASKRSYVSANLIIIHLCSTKSVVDPLRTVLRRSRQSRRSTRSSYTLAHWVTLGYHAHIWSKLYFKHRAIEIRFENKNYWLLQHLQLSATIDNFYALISWSAWIDCRNR